MILLRAFPLSFAILWRFVVVLPILIIAMMMLAFMAFLFMLFFALISPLFTIMIAIAFGVGTTVIPVMVGMRLGLQSYEVRPKNTYLGVMIYAIGYGLFEAVCVLVLVALGGVLYVMATPLTYEELTQIALMGEEALLMQLTSVSPIVGYGILTTVTLLIFSLRAGLLVPFAGASIGADPNGRHHTPFFAFGHGFIGLLALVILTYIGWIMVVPAVMLVGIAIGFDDTLALSLAEAERGISADWTSVLGLEVGLLLVLALFLYLWLFSYVCAGGTLRYRELQVAVENRHQEFANKMEPELKSDEPPMSNDIDMLDLVRSRMPGKRY